MRRMVFGAVLLAAGVTLVAQQPEFRVEVRLVEVEARVTDSSGRPITDLQRGDFTLKENGVAHDIASVAYMSSAERTLPVPPEARTPGGPTFVTVEPAPTWIYLQTESDSADATRVTSALRRFVARQLQPGFRVSIGGRAFSESREQLLQVVEQLERAPYGEEGGIGIVDPLRAQQKDAEEERAVAADMRKQEEGVVPLAGGFISRPEKVEMDASHARAFLTESRLDRQLPMYGEIALRRYEELVNRLALLPGKKVIVLMRPGLRVDVDNVPALRRVVSRAALHRVSFYTMDSRGLQPLVPANDRFVPIMVDRRRRQNVDVIGMMDEQDMVTEGLSSLATSTNGRSIPATNDLGDVLDAVVRDATGYYVLGYYPVDLTASGRYRRIKVGVKRPGAKLEATGGYFEPVSSVLSGSDEGLPLRRALFADLPTDLPVAASTQVFASSDGMPAFVLSAGVRAGALKQKSEKDAPRIDATALVRIVSEDQSRLPVYFERRLSSVGERKSWGQVQQDQTAVVSMSDIVTLPPGRHTWRVVFRDDHSGRLGGAEGQVTIPDFSGAGASSTLLMTGEILRRATDAGEGDDVLDVGPIRFIPQPTRVFRRGETIHLLFDVYNPSPDDVAIGSQGPRVALLHEGKPVTGTVVHGEAFPDPQRRRIRYACAVTTSDLAPGSYTVVVAPPRHDGTSRKPLLQVFQLLAQ